MGYQLIPYTVEWEPKVAQSNARLAADKAMFLIPDRAVRPGDHTGSVRLQDWLAVDDSGQVRGACLLQTRKAWAGNEHVEVVNIQSPLSEGLMDRQFIGLAPWMMREIGRRHPLAYSVGMGNASMPYPRLLKALGWRLQEVPFFFYVLDGRRFLANVRPLREHPKFGLFAKAGASLPFLPNAAFSLLHGWRRSAAPSSPKAPSGTPEWSRLCMEYGFAASRSAEVVNELYPPDDQRVLRLQVPGGLGILRVSRFSSHNYFGNLFVATLSESLCEPGAERQLLDAARKGARDMGAALLLTNQTDPRQCEALATAGWLSHPSNFLVGFSPALAARIGDKPVYVTRGDGDGLLNL
jgi:hypothetical protein